MNATGSNPSDATVCCTTQVRDILARALADSPDNGDRWPAIFDDTSDTGPWDDVARAIEQHVQRLSGMEAIVHDLAAWHRRFPVGIEHTDETAAECEAVLDSICERATAASEAPTPPEPEPDTSKP